MNTVIFEDMKSGLKYNSYHDLNLILTSKIIGAAIPKTYTLDIPYADGELDYTEHYGDVKYHNRALEFDFSIIIPISEFLTLYSRIQNLMNGRRMKITLSDDAKFYYIGRITVNEWKSNKRIGKLVISVNAEPYKRKQAVTVVSRVISGATAITCKNTREWVIPKIITSNEVTVTFGNYTTAFSGTKTDDNIILKEGENVITVTPKNGTTTVSIEYQEGEL